MPYKDRVCQLCLEFVKGCSYRNHMLRHHSVEVSDSEGSEFSSHQTNDAVKKKSRKACRPVSTSSPISPDYVRDAVLCMIRRVDSVNLPSLTAYLAAHFSDLPEVCRMPVIVAAFTAAQKAAATYGDTTLNVDDDRALMAKRSLARWAHGLSAVEPRRARDADDSGRQSRDSSVHSSAEAYSPSTNYLISRELPVPLISPYAQRQMQQEFQEEEHSSTATVQSVEKQVDRSASSTATAEQVRHPATEDEAVGTTTARQALISVALEAMDSHTASVLSMPLLDLSDEVQVQADAETSSNPMAGLEDAPLNGQARNEPLATESALVADKLVASSSSFENVSTARSAMSTPLADERSGLYMPESFLDSLNVLNVDGATYEGLSRPFSVCITPIRTPEYISQVADKEVLEPEIDLYISPQPSIEGMLSHEIHRQDECAGGESSKHKGLKKGKKSSVIPTAHSSDDVEGGTAAVSDNQTKSTEILTAEQKENLKRSSDREESVVQQHKRSRESPKSTVHVVNKKSSPVMPPAKSHFRIPLKPKHDNKITDVRQHDRPGWESEKRRDKPVSHWRTDRDSKRPSASDQRRIPWQGRSRQLPGFQRKQLTTEQLRWLERMPSEWRR